MMRIATDTTTGFKAVGDQVDQIPEERRAEMRVRRARGYVVAQTAYGKFTVTTRTAARRNGWKIISTY